MCRHDRFFVFICVLVLLFSDPELAFASQYSVGSNLFEESVDGVYKIRYEMDDGINNVLNLPELTQEDLPFTLEVPTREGYNFAGWYTDSTYTHKITRITADNACDMVLFAKWTEVIDDNYNVENYAYHKTGALDESEKDLKDCRYSFVDDLEIPGMPSTREQDYLNKLITSESQVLQGLAFSDDLIMMTAYAEDSSTSGSLLLFDRDNGEYLATLKMKENSHLGGIAFDGENVWICHSNSNTLERIPYEYIKEVAAEAPGCAVDASELTEEYKVSNSPSCITYYGGRIWVATHTKIFNSEMISYSYNKKDDKLTSFSKYQIPNKVQGIAFDDTGAVYLSTSYGRSKSSYLKVYSSLIALSQSPNDPDMKVEMPPCSEELAIAGSNVYVLFESASMKYFEGTDGNGTSVSPIDKILQVDVASIW
jgi:uncharacterized repeat protein (TIGR02543 family)